MPNRSPVTTFLFTDLEQSSRMWELDPVRMQPAMAGHDQLARSSVIAHRGSVVKMTGDGICAAFEDPFDAVAAALEFQRSLVELGSSCGVALRARCGLHAGIAERRDNDFYGTVMNRAARIMNAAHGGQTLVSQAVALLLNDRLPEEAALRDLGALRLRDLTSPERIYQLVHPGLRQDFPALRTLESTPNNLPQQVTSFVGRERELADVEKLLADVRLLTLIGAGGLGKTRLSLQAAADVLEDFPDGVWLVELAPMNDARLVPQAIASVLGVKEEAGRPVIEALLKAVKDRRLLLILDNCEHVLPDCAEVAKRLLQAAPDLKVLASSREPLHIAGEQTYPVPSLDIPALAGKAKIMDIGNYEAVRLFVDRASAAQPSFQLTEQNVATVIDICRRLDGIPLAIELAAARVRALSVESIAERLSDCFRLLTGGDRTAMPRQQTLRACIDWSFELLTEHERVLLLRLAVFAGGWTIEAAEAVGTGGDIDETHVLDLLTRLVEKSLVSVEPDGARYRLLETVRQYAQRRLQDSGDSDAVRARHLNFYLALAEVAWSELVGANQARWLARLDHERENVLSAHAWCSRAPNGAELGLRLISAVKPYLIIRGLLGLALALTVEALKRPGAEQRNVARCRGLMDAGQFGFSMGRYGEASEFLRESLGIAREIGNTPRVAAVLQFLGLAYFGLGDFVTARRHLEEALSLARELGNERELAAALTALAQLNRAEGNLPAADSLCDETLVLARKLEDRESIAIALLNLAMIAICRGSEDRARGMLREVHAIVEEIGSKPAGQSVLEVSAGLGALLKHWERTAFFFGAAEAQTRHTGLHRDPADEAFLAPLIAQARETMGTDAFVVAESAGRACPYDQAIVDARDWLDSLQPSVHQSPAVP